MYFLSVYVSQQDWRSDESSLRRRKDCPEMFLILGFLLFGAGWANPAPDAASRVHVFEVPLSMRAYKYETKWFDQKVKLYFALYLFRVQMTVTFRVQTENPSLLKF